MPNDYDAWLAAFTSLAIDVSGIQTAIYAAPLTDLTVPTVLFVHGLNGDYHGLVPVAYRLRNNCRALFVDLPGHGRSAIPSGEVLETLQEWARALPAAFKEAIAPLDAVVGHSFGCFVAVETGVNRAALLNPPFAASSFSRYGTKLLERMASVLGGVYSSYPAMIRRGHWLLHHRTKEADDIIAWSSGHTHVSKEQFRFQAHFGDVLTAAKLIDVDHWMSYHRRELSRFQPTMFRYLKCRPRSRMKSVRYFSVWIRVRRHAA